MTVVFDGHLRECSNGTVREHQTKVRENQFNACVNMHLIETQLSKTLQPCCCALLNSIWEKCFIQSFFSEVHDPAIIFHNAFQKFQRIVVKNNSIVKDVADVKQYIKLAMPVRKCLQTFSSVS